jgi:hypothetical protein
MHSTILESSDHSTYCRQIHNTLLLFLSLFNNALSSAYAALSEEKQDDYEWRIGKDVEERCYNLTLK